MASHNEKKSSSGLFVVMAKIGGKLAGPTLKLFKALKAGKVVLAAASVGSYALIFTWQFAFIIVGMLVIHEYGHLKMMQHYKMRTKGMYLIPFVGAAAVAEENFPTRKSEGIIALAGPLVGGSMAGVCWLIYSIDPNPYIAAVGSFTALLTLFNLLPILPLDGGRVVKSVALSIQSRLGMTLMIAAMAITAGFAIKEKLLIVAVLFPIAAAEVFLEWRQSRKPKTYSMWSEPKAAMTTEQARVMFAAYLGLAFAMWVIMLVLSHEPGAGAALSILQDR